MTGKYIFNGVIIVAVGKIRGLIKKNLLFNLLVQWNVHKCLLLKNMETQTGWHNG